MSVVSLQVFYESADNKNNRLISQNLCFAVLEMKKNPVTCMVENLGFVNKNYYKNSQNSNPSEPNQFRLVVSTYNTGFPDIYTELHPNIRDTPTKPRDVFVLTHPQNFFLDRKDGKDSESDRALIRDAIVSAIQSKWSSFGRGLY